MKLWNKAGVKLWNKAGVKLWNKAGVKQSELVNKWGKHQPQCKSIYNDIVSNNLAVKLKSVLYILTKYAGGEFPFCHHPSR